VSILFCNILKIAIIWFDFLFISIDIWMDEKNDNLRLFIHNQLASLYSSLSLVVLLSNVVPPLFSLLLFPTITEIKSKEAKMRAAMSGGKVSILSDLLSLR
jgi:hypothetical protein